MGCTLIRASIIWGLTGQDGGTDCDKCSQAVFVTGTVWWWWCIIGEIQYFLSLGPNLWMCDVTAGQERRPGNRRHGWGNFHHQQRRGLWFHVWYTHHQPTPVRYSRHARHIWPAGSHRWQGMCSSTMCDFWWTRVVLQRLWKSAHVRSVSVIIK